MLTIKRMRGDVISGVEKIQEEVPANILELINDGHNVVVVGNGTDLETRWEVIQR